MTTHVDEAKWEARRKLEDAIDRYAHARVLTSMDHIKDKDYLGRTWTRVQDAIDGVENLREES